jgi:hypothetical protein
MKLEKMELPKEQESIIRRALERNVDEIIPNSKPNTLTYHKLEDLVEEMGLKKFQRSLKGLANKGFLEEREHARAIFCPNCGSIHVHSKYKCPKCESTKVTRKELIEHSHCGYIGNKDGFESNDRLVCPNCGADLGPISEDPAESGKKSYNVIGSSFVCDDCENHFDRPHVIHNCTNCGNVFNHKTALYNKLYAYRLTDQSKSSSSQPESLGVLRKIEEILRENDYVVDSPGELEGQSDVVQKFNILARRRNEKLVVDVSDGERKDLIDLLGKKIDVEADKAVLIDFSGKMERTELAQNQNILLLDGKQDNLEKTLLDYIKDRKRGLRSIF